MGEASDILAQRQIVHAAIHLDALGLAHLPSAALNNGVMYDNLRSICRNYAALGVKILTRARNRRRCSPKTLSRNHSGLQRCGLPSHCERRRNQRRVGCANQGYRSGNMLLRVAKLNVILDRARLEDFAVTNEDRPLTDVALEMLARAGWI